MSLVYKSILLHFDAKDLSLVPIHGNDHDLSVLHHLSAQFEGQHVTALHKRVKHGQSENDKDAEGDDVDEHTNVVVPIYNFESK